MRVALLSEGKRGVVTDPTWVGLNGAPVADQWGSSRVTRYQEHEGAGVIWKSRVNLKVSANTIAILLSGQIHPFWLAWYQRYGLLRKECRCGCKNRQQSDREKQTGGRHGWD